jgi:hypothetical protein
LYDSAVPKESQSQKQDTSNVDLNELLPPEAEEFKKLCQLARFIQQQRPWKFMDETDVFGVQDPDTGELSFVSVMGIDESYKAIAVYRGVEGLYAWREFEEMLEVDPETDEANDMLLEIPQLQMSFGLAEFLEDQDREVIKRSGVKFSKEKPLFRSFWPGYFPWFLTRGEARQLIHVLQQTIEVAAQFYQDQSVIPLNEDPEDRDYLIRIPYPGDGPEMLWRSEIQEVEPPVSQLVPFRVEDDVVQKLKDMPRGGPQEMDLFIVPKILGEEGERPRVLYGLMVADADSGYIFAMEALEAVNGIDLLYAELPERVANIWLQEEMVPVEVRTCSVRVLNMLELCANDLDFQLSLQDELPAIDEAKISLLEQVLSEP